MMLLNDFKLQYPLLVTWLSPSYCFNSVHISCIPTYTGLKFLLYFISTLLDVALFILIFFFSFNLNACLTPEHFLPGYLKSVLIVPVFLSHITLLESSSMTFKSYVYVRGIKRFKFQYLLNEFNYPTSSIWVHCYCSSLIYSRFSSIVILINKMPSERVFSFYFLNKSLLSRLFCYYFTNSKQKHHYPVYKLSFPGIYPV